MPILGSGSILPPWLVLPLAGLTMLVIAGHVLAIQQIPMPARRRRIRTASGFLMLLITGLLAYAVGIAKVAPGVHVQPPEARTFILTWLVIIVLLGMVVILAGLDALATVRFNAERRRELRARLREGMAEAVRNRTTQRRAGESPGSSDDASG